MRAWHVTRSSWHAWHLWRWTMRCGDVQRSGDIVTRVTRVMDGHVPGCERYYIVHSQGWWGIYLHPPRNNDLGIHGDDDSSLNGTMTLSIKNIPRRGREFSVWAYFQNIVSKRWKHFHNLHISWIVWLLVTEPTLSSSVVALMGLSTCSGASSASVSAATQDSAICR